MAALAPKPKPGKKELELEAEMRKKFRAKCRFRALYRLVSANAYWLMEDVDDYEGDDVKRRVQQAVRSKAKKKQLLNISDKALLNKPADERTGLERKYIYRIIGGLKCFKKYPNHVKKKLAAVTYFKYYSPGRVIVRQHHDAHALYFIVTGDVAVSQMILDELVGQYISVELGQMHAGDMFGEVSLLHNIPRTATCTTVGHCELLALMKEDFKNVLMASVQKQWDEVLRAMSAFTYFDSLDEVARREGCIVAKMKSYEQNDIILGDGQGVPNFVYFTLSGRCQMIETMQVTVTTICGKDYFELYDPYVPKEESEQDIDTKYFKAYKNFKKQSSAIKERSITSSLTTQKEATESFKDTRQSGGSQARTDSIRNLESKERKYSHDSSETKVILEKGLKSVTSTGGRDSAQTNVLLHPAETKHQSRRRESVRVSIATDIPTGGQQQEDAPASTQGPKEPDNLKTYFMQVCQFYPGSTFGFGENMRDRRIVAMTQVDCMLLPLVWLLQRNTANIWTRIQHYLERKIPSKKELFKQFVSDRRWQTYRDKLVEEIVSRSNTVNFTTMHDVPYSIRMDEKTDI